MTLLVENLSYHYDDGRNIFKNVTLQVSQGDILVILGSNGVGKSTLLNCVANHLTPQQGKVTIEGKNVRDMSAVELAQKAAYVAQFHNPIFAYSVRDVVLLGRSAYMNALKGPSHEDVEISNHTMEQMGIIHLAEKPYTNISGGERQLVMFAQAIVQSPSYLILDEPTSHLDFGNQIKCLEIIENMAQNGFGVLMTSHFPDHSLMFDHNVAILHNGRTIDCGSAANIITKGNMEKMYGIKVEINNQAFHRNVCIPMRDL